MAKRQTNILDMFRNKVAKLAKEKKLEQSEPNVPTAFVLEKELAQDVQKVEQLQQPDNAEFRLSDPGDDQQTQQAIVAAQGYIVNPCTSAATQAEKASSKLTVDRNLLNESKRKYCRLYIQNCGHRALTVQPHWIDKFNWLNPINDTNGI